MSRNWMKTMWAPSFRGVSFETETDSVAGGRRIVEHEFPMRDMPFLEDLGEKKRSFSLTAYVASDNADGEAAALIAACSQRGPAILVLAIDGPILVRCLDFERSREKDRAGKLAFSLKFSRQGVGFALVSVSSLANLVFVAADNLASAAASMFAGAVVTNEQPDQVVGAAVDGIQDGAATFEAVRTSATVDVTVSADQRVAIQTIYDTAVSAVVTDPAGLAGDLVAVARALGDGMAPADAVQAFAPVVDSLVLDVQSAPYLTHNAALSAANRLAAYRVARLAAITAYAEALVRTEIKDRPTGITLRADAAEMFDRELEGLVGPDMGLNVEIVTLRNATIDYLSRAILDAAPVVIVEANRSMPSLWWSYRLYEDPERSRELSDRNRVAHPSFMPSKFEALSR